MKQDMAPVIQGATQDRPVAGRERRIAERHPWKNGVQILSSIELSVPSRMKLISARKTALKSGT